jgi:hypothetical protein
MGETDLLHTQVLWRYEGQSVLSKCNFFRDSVVGKAESNTVTRCAAKSSFKIRKGMYQNSDFYSSFSSRVAISYGA